MYGLASTVSVTRVTAGQHFPSDVFVGSILGYLIGDYVAHKRGESRPHPRRQTRSRAGCILEHVDIGIQ